MVDDKYKIYSTSQQAWDAMYAAVEKAQQSIYWELYIFVDDEEGDRFFDLLEVKARAKLDVKLIVDYLGSFGLSRRRAASLRQAGVDLHFFHERKHRYRGLWRKLVSRTHRKILVVDEYIGFIGGVNIDKRMKDWLDIHMSIKGDAVRSMLRAFAKMYIICGGEKKAVKHLLKYKFRVAKEISDIEFIYDDSDSKRSKARKIYTEALLKARERVILFSPYYIPDATFLKALWRARKRGVRVDLLIPFRTDVRIATYAAYTFFSLMKRYGVKVHLMRRMMHGKGVVVDDDWAMIGSSNLEQGSFHDNYEANVRLRDRLTVKKLKSTLEAWIGKSVRLEDINWEDRGWWQKKKESIAARLYRLWHWRSGRTR